MMSLHVDRTADARRLTQVWEDGFHQGWWTGCCVGMVVMGTVAVVAALVARMAWGMS